MDKEVKIPKYVVNLVRARTKALWRFNKASYKVDKYCESIGLNYNSEFFDDACLYSDIRMYCEVDGGASLTLEAIKKQLNANKRRMV